MVTFSILLIFTIGGDLVHWFKEIAWNDLAVAAVACISPLGVWLPFWFEHRQKTRDRRQRQLGELERLRNRLKEEIEPWANEWPDDSYNAEWYLPDWHVLPFEWRHVEGFNRLILAGDYPRELTAGLVRLEGAARRFHAALAKQDEFRSGVPFGLKENLQPVFIRAQRRPAALSNEELADRAPGLSEEGRRWLQELYQGNRRIHVESIGRRGQSDGLYDSFRAVVEGIERVRIKLQSARDPWWYTLGHVSAGVLALTGSLFLVDFWWTFSEDRFRSHAVVHPVSSVTISKPSGAPDTSRSSVPATKRSGLITATPRPRK